MDKPLFRGINKVHKSPFTEIKFLNGAPLRKKILYILPTLGQPRYVKRIEVISKAYDTTKLLSFDRTYHKGAVPSFGVELLGRVTKGAYYRRLPVFFKSLFKIRQHAKTSNATYAFGLDVGLLVLISTLGLRCKLILEVGDIRDIQTSSNLSGKVFRVFERLLVHKTTLVVLTSESFLTQYFSRYKNTHKFLIQENKVQYNWFTQGYFKRSEKNIKSSITIGYFGLLRCRWTAECLYNLLSQYNTNFDLLVAGFVFNDDPVFERLFALDNVTFLGEYKNPHDLLRLYNNVDIVWAAYKPIQANDFNLKWARTNRFYEAAVFGKPIILRAGSQDALAAESLGHAFIINDEHEAECAKVLAENLPKQISLLTERANNIDAIEHTTYEQEKQLLIRLEEIFD